MDNERNANIAARRADLREMLRLDDDHYEGIDKDDALLELLDLLDEADAAPRTFACLDCDFSTDSGVEMDAHIDEQHLVGYGT